MKLNLNSKLALHIKDAHRSTNIKDKNKNRKDGKKYIYFLKTICITAADNLIYATGFFQVMVSTYLRKKMYLLPVHIYYLEIFIFY